MRFSTFFAGCYLVSQITLVCPLMAAPPGANANASAADAKTSSTSNTEQKLTQLSTRMLRQIELARQAIAKQDTQTALNHVRQALGDQSQVSSLAKTNGLPTVLPLYSEFDEDSVLGPLASKRNGNQKGNSPSSNTVGVEHAAGQYTFIGIDLDKTKQRLNAAETALNNKNLQSADDSLAAVGNELVMETVESDLPLLTVRGNLGIAESAAKKDHFHEAATALKDASSALDRYSRENPRSHGKDAESLSKTIGSYAQSITHNSAGAAAKIDGWWHEVDSWFAKQARSS